MIDSCSFLWSVCLLVHFYVSRITQFWVNFLQNQEVKLLGIPEKKADSGLFSAHFAVHMTLQGCATAIIGYILVPGTQPHRNDNDS